MFLIVEVQLRRNLKPLGSCHLISMSGAHHSIWFQMVTYSKLLLLIKLDSIAIWCTGKWKCYAMSGIVEMTKFLAIELIFVRKKYINHLKELWFCVGECHLSSLNFCKIFSIMCLNSKVKFCRKIRMLLISTFNC